VRACDLLLPRFDINSAMIVLPSASGCLDAILPGAIFQIPGSIFHGGRENTFQGERHTQTPTTAHGDGVGDGKGPKRKETLGSS